MIIRRISANNHEISGMPPFLIGMVALTIPRLRPPYLLYSFFIIISSKYYDTTIDRFL